VRIVGGRLQPVVVRGIRGTVTLAGAETTDRSCPDGTGSSQIADCIQSTRSLTGGTLRLSSPARGRLAFGRIRGARLAVANCPDEIAAVRLAPAGPSPASIGLPIGKLSHPRARTVTTRVSFRRTDPFAAPQEGSLQLRVAWTLTFTRAKT
jgi:phage tail tape-measure protein